MTVHTVLKPVPTKWDRRGLPAWAYRSEALLDLERERLFLTHWQVAGHASDLPAPGDWITFDLLGERALLIRGRDGVVRAFHNLCRHRGARLADGDAGHCRGALVCPFHGWVYEADGRLRGAARPDTFGDMDRANFGLRPVEMEEWHGFLFVRFRPGPQPAVAALMAPFAADFAAYRADDLVPAVSGPWRGAQAVNWKSVRDVDNEGYHVAMAHPGLQDLYGPTYRDAVYTNGISTSWAEFGSRPGRLWSVRRYVALSKALPARAGLPERLRQAWTYYGVFPNAVIAFTPESAQYYQEMPLSPGQTELRGRLYRHPNESRAARVARYLADRIDRDTSEEDRRLSRWSDESMRSSAFEAFHLSDLEYGVRNHHDEMRRLLPVLRLDRAPAEAEMAQANDAMAADSEETAWAAATPAQGSGKQTEGSP